MNEASKSERLRRLHEAQGAFYAGGSEDALRAELPGDVIWHVPGRNAIAGHYEGIEAVIGYFARRRDLASRTFRLHPGEVLIGERRWSTVGLYRFRSGRIAECWLLPLDPEEFDGIWRSDAPPGPALGS